MSIFLSILQKSFLANTFIIAAILYSIVIVIYRVKYGHFKFHKYKFSISRHYLAVAPLFLASVSLSFFNQSPIFVLIFILLGFWGMIGEVLTVIYWRVFFTKPIYIYTEGAILKGYTSVINVIPWAAGYVVFSTVNNILGVKIPYAEQVKQMNYIWPIFTVSLVLIYAIRAYAKKKIQTAEDFNWLDYALFNIPIVLSIGYISIAFHSQYFILAIGYGLVAFIVEYLYGKYARWMLGKQLWYYPVCSIDDQHTSFLNIPVFALGGFWFMHGHLFLNLLFATSF